MKRRRLAFAMAVMIAFTSIPTNGYHVHAEDVIAEDLIVETDTVTEEPFDDELADTDLTWDGSAEETVDLTQESEYVTEAAIPTLAEPVTEAETEKASEEVKPEAAAEIPEEDFLLAVEEVGVIGETASAVELYDLPEATALEVGKSCYVEVAENEVKYFSFTVTEENAGSYRIYSYDNSADSDTDIYLYEEQDGVLSQIDYDEQGGNNSNFSLGRKLEAGKTYYYEVGEYYNRAASFYIMFEEAPALSEMTVVHAPYHNTLVYRIDEWHRYSDGLEVKMSYADGTDYNANISGDQYDSCGNQIEFAIYPVNDDGSYGEEVTSEEVLQPGNYVRKVTCESWSYEYPMTVVAIAEAVADNQIDMNVGSISLRSEGQMVLASFVPETSGQYHLSIDETQYFALHTAEETIVPNDWSKNIRAELTAGTTYYVAFYGWAENTTDAVIKVNMTKTPQSVSVSADTSSVDAFVLDDYLHDLRPTVVYSETDSEQVTSLTRCDYYDEELETNLSRLQGYTESGDLVYVDFLDADGNNIGILSETDDPDVLTVSGTYQVKAYLAEYAELEAGVYSITVSTPDSIAAALTVNTGVDYSITQESNQWFKFTAEEAKEYIFKVDYCVNENSSSDPLVDIYTVQDNKFCKAGSIETNYANDQVIINVNPDAGETVYLVLHGNEWKYGTGSLVICEKQSVQSLSIQPDALYSPVNIREKMYYVPLTVTYSDGTSENITYWTSSENVEIEEGLWAETALTVYLENGETVMLEMYKDTEKLYIPGSGDGSIPYGTFTLKASVKNNTSVSAEAQIKIQGTADAFAQMYVDQPIEGTILPNEPKLATFVPTVSGKYIIGANISSWVVYEADGSEWNDVSYNNGYELEAGKTYAVAMVAAWGYEENYYLTARLKKEVSSLVLHADSSYLPVELETKFRSVPVTVNYTDGSSEEITWWSGNEGVWDDEDNYTCTSFTAWTNNSDELRLSLIKNEAETEMPFDNEFFEAGTYTCRVYMAQNSAVCAESKVTVEGVPEGLSETVLGTAEEFEVSDGKVKWMLLKPQQTDSYVIDIDTESYIEFLIRVLEVDTAGLCHTENGQGWGTFSSAFSMESGKTYAVLLYAASEGNTASGTVEVHRQKKVTEISLSDSYEYSFIEAAEKLRQIPVTVTYDDQTTAVITNWESGNIWDENGGWYRSIRADAGDGQWIRMHLESEDGSFVTIPEDSRYEMKVYGSFTLAVDIETDDSVCSTAKLEISGTSDSMQKLTIGEEAAIAVGADQQLLLTFDVPESGTYLVDYERNNGDSLWSFGYRLTDGTAEHIWNGWWYDEECQVFTATEAGSYVLLFEEIHSEDTDGVIKVRRQKEASSVAVAANDIQLDLFAAREIRNTEVTITYTDGSSEVLRSWSASDYYDEENDRYIGCLEKRSEEKSRYTIRMYDEQGLPVEIINTYGDYNSVGNYTLKVYVENEFTGEEATFTGAAQALEITEPKAEALIVGEKKSVTFTGESDYHVFGLTVEEGAEGLYYFKAQCNTADLSVDAFIYKETEKTVERVGGNRSVLSEGTYYYLCESSWGNDGENPAEICLVKVPEISSVEVVNYAGFSDLVAGLDKIPYDQLRAKITYADGTEELVSDYDCDSYENQMRFLCYKYEDNSANFEKGYRYNGTLPEGSYYLAAVVSCGDGEVRRGGIPLTVVTKEEAAAENVISTETNEITLAGKTTYNCALYVPETDGYYLLKPDMYLDQLRIFDAAGELDYQWVDDYSIRVELTGGEAYVIAARAGETKNYTLNIELEKQIVDAQVSYWPNDELIAGLDWFNNYDFIVDLDFGNGETVSLNGTDDYADGNGFSYEIVNTTTGQKVNPYDSLTAGTYEIVAVQRTGSAVYRTSSAVYRTESAIHQNTVKTQPITVTVSALDVSKLPVMEEETEYELKASGKRQMFAFTPEKDALYTLEREEWISWRMYEVSEDGELNILNTYRNMLNAGQTYVLYMEKVNEAQTVKMTSNIQELALDTVMEGQTDAYGKLLMKFISEASGSYEFTVEMPEIDGTFDVQLNGYYEDDGSKEEPVRFSMYLEEGEFLTITVNSDADSPASCLVTVKEEEETPQKTVESYSVSAKATDGFYAEYLDFYNYERLFELTAVYEDGTSETCILEDWDDAWVDWYELIEETDTTATYNCTIGISGDEDEYLDVELTLDKISQETSLEEGQAAAAQVSASRYNFFRFKAPEDGWYYLDISGIDSYGCYISGVQQFNNRYYLSAGINSIIVLYLDDWSDEVGESFTIKIVKAKDVAGMELLTPAEPFVYGVGPYGDEMTAEVTYTDGSKAVISGDMYMDAYGNEICMESRALSNGRRRVYMRCGTSRVYCDVEAFDYSTLPQLTVNKCSWVDIKGIVGDYVLLSFVPSETGTYTYDFQGEGSFSLGVSYIYDVRTQRNFQLATELTAGKQYVVAFYVIEADCEQIGVTISNGRTVCDEHSWDEGVVSAAATCCTNGVMVYTCTVCNETKSEVIPADGITHKFSKYTANGDAACTENGTETAVCAYGCGTTDTRDASQGALGHVYDSGKITKAATCCETGEITYTCTRAECGHTYTEEIAPDGVSHTFSVYTYNEDATCSEDGTETAVCTNGCEARASDTRTAEGTMKAHSFTQYISNEDATCFADGTKTAVCDYEGCDVTDTLTDEGSKLEHVFENYQPDGNTTCLSNGTETAECSNNCGVTHTRTAETGATGHSFTEYTSDGNATCEADGTKTAKCDNCSATETVADEGSASGHEYGDDWTVTKAATCTESGLKVRYCSHNCGEFESEVIPAVGHNYEGQEKLTIEATEEADGMIYQECANGCGEINVLQVLVCTAEQEKINEVADIVNVEEGTAVDTASAVNQIQNISNQALIDSVETTDESGTTTGVDGMKLVTDLEEQIKADTSDETPNVGDTSTVDGEGNKISNASAAGAAVTVAAAIQQDASSYQADETYSAQLEISKVASSAAVMTADDEEQTADTGNVYVVDIHLNIVDSSNTVVATKVSLAAPIQVTMPVPEDVLSGQTKLYHLVGEEAVEVKFTSNGDGTITFYAPSFSEWSLEKEHHVAAWTVDEEATCTQTGLKHGICIGCGRTVTAVIETVAHEYETKRTEATCCTAGEEYKECFGCQDKKTVKVIPATGEHDYSAEGVVITDATCTENGTKRFTCTTEGCSAYKEELILKGHSYDTQFTVDQEATCTTAGSKSIHCTKCNDKKNVTEIPATGHTWASEGTLTKAPTCTEEGEITYECTVDGCDAEDTKKVKANGHSFSDAYTTDQEATCIKAGSKSRHCVNCDVVTDEKEIPKTDIHNFVIETEDKQEPTCTEAGWIVYQCDTVECTEKQKVDLEAKDHEYRDFTVEKEATCGDAGSRSKYCINGCGDKIGTEVIPATGDHELQTVVDKAATCGEAGSQHVECKNCTYKEAATEIKATGAHDLQTVVDKNATCGGAGSQHVECKNCTYKETATTIPATGKHDLQTVVDKNATCGEVGSQHVECKNCTYKEAATTISATGKHDLQTVVDKNATCGEAGSQHVECKNCTYKEAATTISATGKHDLQTIVDKAATCGETGSQHVECKNCTYKETATEIKATGEHSYGAYEVTKEATALAEGEETRTCSICGHEDSKTVDKLKATIKLTTKSIPLQVKKSVNLKQVVTGLAEGDKIESWSSSKKSVATVSKTGKVTAKKAGTTKITVTLASKKTATITVKVQKKAVKATKISNVKNVTLYLKKQKTFKLEPIVTPISTLQKITYSSSNKKIVTVSKKGVLTAKKKGKAKITIKCGSKKKTITVTVKK